MANQLQPPDYKTDQFELCYAEGLGLIVFCRTCDVAVLVWDSTQNIWTDADDRPILPMGKIACWGGCKNEVHVPSGGLVQRFEREHD